MGAGTQAGVLEWCRRFPVVPVLRFEEARRAVAVCGALIEGGAAVVEITFRSAAAAAAMAAVAKAYPRVVVAAGSVRTVAQLREARAAGAAFAVSPGATEALLDADVLPLLPGAATASEVMRLQERGFSFVKFFPAAAAGGVAAVAALGGPLSDVLFCPTGGVGAENAGAYLALANVACVGGSWLAEGGEGEADLAGVTARTREAGRLAA